MFRCHGGTGLLGARLPRSRLSQRFDRRRISRWEPCRRLVVNFLRGSRENVLYRSRGRFLVKNWPASSRREWFL